MGESAYQMLSILFQLPLITIKELGARTSKSYNTALKATKRFQEIGILQEAHGKGRERVYQFDSYLKLLEKEY